VNAKTSDLRKCPGAAIRIILDEFLRSRRWCREANSEMLRSRGCKNVVDLIVDVFRGVDPLHLLFGPRGGVQSVLHGEFPLSGKWSGFLVTRDFVIRGTRNGLAGRPAIERFQLYSLLLPSPAPPAGKMRIVFVTAGFGESHCPSCGLPAIGSLLRFVTRSGTHAALPKRKLRR